MSVTSQPHNVNKSGEKSLDYDLCVYFHVCMMVVIAAHLVFGLGIKGEVGVTCGAAVLAFIISIRNRRKLGWRWPGAKIKEVVGALGVAILILFFIGSALPGTSIFNPNLFPFCMAGANMLVFVVLRGLNVVHESQREFLRQGGENQPEEPPPPPKPQVPAWKNFIATAFKAYFLLVWITGVGFFWKYNSACRGGSPQPTITQTERLSSHGRAVYITRHDMRSVQLLKHSGAIGILSIFVVGAFLHFVPGVKVFSTARTNPK